MISIHLSYLTGPVILLMLQEISASSAVEVEGNNTAGWLRLQTFSAYLKWSKIGKLHVRLIQVNQTSIHIFTLQQCMHFFLIKTWMKPNRMIK